MKSSMDNVIKGGRCLPVGTSGICYTRIHFGYRDRCQNIFSIWIMGVGRNVNGKSLSFELEVGYTSLAVNTK